MSERVSIELQEKTARITMDDGKVNAISTDMLNQLNTALDIAEQAGATIVLTGRPGVFSAGFDLAELRGTPQQLHTLLRAGAQWCLRLLTFPHPVIAVCTGHAYPMGAFMLMSSDFRIGTTGHYGIGMNEVKIGIAAPRFAIELARHRLVPAYFNRTAILGEMFAPEDARNAGFLDMITAPENLDQAITEKLDDFQGVAADPHLVSKHRVRGPLVQLMQDAIDQDLTLENARASLQKQGLT